MKLLIAVALTLSTACASAMEWSRAYLAASPGANRFLTPHQFLVSPQGKFFLVVQGDGNLVIYRGDGPGNNQGHVWSAQTQSASHPAVFMAIQEDGNLVVYRGQPGDHSNPVLTCPLPPYQSGGSPG